MALNLDNNPVDKITLDDILERHKAQPVGNGYIDIIVSRNNYKDFVADLVTNDFKIKSISWWEWCADKKKNEYGLGGPESVFYKGWFSEIPIDLDYINFSANTTKQSIIKEIIEKIESKTISFPDKTATFKECMWMTPAICIDVPEGWRNKYSVPRPKP